MKFYKGDRVIVNKNCHLKSLRGTVLTVAHSGLSNGSGSVSFLETPLICESGSAHLNLERAAPIEEEKVMKKFNPGDKVVADSGCIFNDTGGSSSSGPVFTVRSHTYESFAKGDSIRVWDCGRICNDSSHLTLYKPAPVGDLKYEISRWVFCKEENRPHIADEICIGPHHPLFTGFHEHKLVTICKECGEVE